MLLNRRIFALRYGIMAQTTLCRTEKHAACDRARSSPRQTTGFASKRSIEMRGSQTRFFAV
jgi:hypothetical protein